MKRAPRHLSHAMSMHTIMRCEVREKKLTCEVNLSTHPVGHSGSPSAVNETNRNKMKITKTNLMNSFPIPFRLVPPRCA